MPKQVEDGGRRSAVAGGARRPLEVGGLGKGGLGEGVVGGGWWPAERSGRRSAVAGGGRRPPKVGPWEPWGREASV